MVPFTYLVAVKEEDCFAQYVRNEDEEEQDADDELFIQDEKDVAGYVRARKKPRRN